jgi:hypothetical protein
MTHTFFAIKRLSDGKFMPAGRERGFTFDEPSDGPPRLFRRERDAKMALDHWLRGELSVVPFYDEQADYEGVNKVIVRKPERKAEDMAVVEMRLTEISQ